MKRLIRGASALLIATALAFTGMSAASAADFNVPPAPSLESPVVDTSGKLSADQIKQIVATIHNDKVEGKRQLAVLVVDTLGESSIEDASLAVARKWGVGEKSNNNGVLLMVAVKERKMRIEVGTGLEGALPDITAKRITDKYITPAFKKGDYFTGIRDGVVQIDAAVAGEKFESSGSSDVDGGTVLIIFLVTFGIIALVIGLIVYFATRRRKGGRGGHGGGSDADGFFLGMLLGSLTSGSGGSSSGSSSGGGGSSFGGGGFDGGGSSSDW
jgi:uncharacterized protein